MVHGCCMGCVHGMSQGVDCPLTSLVSALCLESVPPRLFSTPQPTPSLSLHPPSALPVTHTPSALLYTPSALLYTPPPFRPPLHSTPLPPSLSLHPPCPEGSGWPGLPSPCP
eukprot:362142-Chlamydomonas_euryale.AAC.1